MEGSGWAFHLIPLLCTSVLDPVPHCFIHSVIVFQVQYGNPAALLVLFKIALAILLWFHSNFRRLLAYFSISVKNVMEILVRTALSL